MQSMAQTICRMLVATPRVSSLRGASKLLSVAGRIAAPDASPVAVCVMSQGHWLKLDRRSLTEKSAYYTGRYDCEENSCVACCDLAIQYAMSAATSAFMLYQLLAASSTSAVIFTRSSR